MRLWNIGRSAERSAGKGECGYMSKEGHRQGTKLLGKRLWGIWRGIERIIWRRECGYGAKGGVQRGKQGSEIVVMEHREREMEGPLLHCLRKMNLPMQKLQVLLLASSFLQLLLVLC